MFRFRLVLAFFAAAGLRIQAQDALRQALALDPALTPKENSVATLAPEQPHLGPVRFNLSAYCSAGYNDNISESEFNRLSDVTLRPGLNVALFWPATERSELRFGTDISYVHYLTQSQYSGLEISPDSAISYAVSFADARLNFYDQFNYWRQVTTESSLANVAVLPRLDNTIGARLSWEPGRWLAQLGYGHEIFLAESAANNYLDRSSENLFGRLGWRLAEKSEAGLEASGSFTSYRVHLQSDNRSLSLGPYADWQLRPAIHVTLRGGPTFYAFDSNGAARGSGGLNSYYLGASLSHQLTAGVSYQINLRRDVQLGLNQGSDYVEQWTVNSSLAWAVTPRVNLGIVFTYENGSQPLPVAYLGPYVFETTERFERFGGGPQVSWRLTEKLTASANYSYWQRDSSLPGRNNNGNTAALTLGYAF